MFQNNVNFQLNHIPASLSFCCSSAVTKAVAWRPTVLNLRARSLTGRLLVSHWCFEFPWNFRSGLIQILKSWNLTGMWLRPGVNHGTAMESTVNSRFQELVLASNQRPGIGGTLNPVSSTAMRGTKARWHPSNSPLASRCFPWLTNKSP